MILRLSSPPRGAGTARRSAAAAVEFAIVGPIVIFLVFGMIEFGRLMMVSNVLTNAAREGGRCAVLTGSTTGQVEDVIADYLAASGVSGHTTAVSPDPATATAGTSITVTITVPANQVSWLPFSLYAGNTTLSSAVIMRKESNNP